MSEETKDKNYDWDKLAEEGVEITPDMVVNYEAGLSDDDLMGMVDGEEIKVEWEDERPNNITAEKLEQWVKGEITWAQVEGITMDQAYAFAELGYQLFEQGRYDDAQQIFEGLVIANPYDGYFHSVLGSIYARKDMHEEAVVEYTIALELDDEDLQSFVNRAELLLQHGEFEYAMEDLKEAILLDPDAEDPAGIRARALAAATAGLIEQVLKEKESEDASGDEG
jgi:tetratricopeptide (TPR) repeat protein